MIQNKDLEQLQEKGITNKAFEQQIERFKEGFPALKVERPASLTDGIIPFSDKFIKSYKDIFHQELTKGLQPLKFVPASGAASRMFKALYQYLENPLKFSKLKAGHPVLQVITELPKFAFFEELKKLFPGKDLENKDIRISLASEIIGKILNEDGLNYGSLPKGLILFHKYPSMFRTSMTEHLAEGAKYAKDKNGKAMIHFTVSPEHLDLFKAELDSTKPRMEKETGTSFEVSFSFQKPHTDTIAVFSNNEPFRDENGKLFFRPGGHGALIENLDDCDADIIFIKNIDNVVPEHKLPLIADYKQALAGLALEIRNNVYNYINQLEETSSSKLIDDIRNFLRESLHTDFPRHLMDTYIDEQRAYLLQFLNRPIRVCGMVKNEGEPGGGPFWVKDKNMQDTLQIVESSQINMNNPDQQKIFEASTHFNPVDLVCITKDHKGKKFNLLNYVDQETGFISGKSIGGNSIKALELPGLWNGAMANWLTIFVEVPVETFNPVKTINDLLRPAHQPE